MRKILYFFLLLSHTLASAQQVINLGGLWDFGIGDVEHYDDVVELPGSMLTNDKGNPVSVTTQWTGSLYDSSYYFNPYMEKYRHEGQMKFPFFLTPERHYVGNAWYRRSVYIPDDWDESQRITLFLERPHIETTVFVNGHEVGHQMSLSVPHRYDVTDYIKKGQRNTIAIRVYNGIENVCVGQDSHSVTDQTQGNWNGIAGRIELQSQWKNLNLQGINVGLDIDRNVVQVTAKLENLLGRVRFMPLYDYWVTITLIHVTGPLSGLPFASGDYKAVGNTVRAEFPIEKNGRIQLWDEFSPTLYCLRIEVGSDVFETLVGFREISIRNRQLYINRRPLFLRGTVENCCFPETGYPPTDEASWRNVFIKCKEYGINHVRFHSYCPPEAAFAAADQLGIYLQPEGPSWPNHGVRLRRGQKIDDYLLEESKRIVDEYGHHPSFVMMAAGNEPAGDWVSYCNDWVKAMEQYDPSKIYCGASVGGGWAWDNGSQYHVKGGARGLDWDRHAPSSDDDYYSQIEFPRNYNQSTPNNSPIIAHEQGQWCAFPDLSETSDYTGAYKARNFDIFRDLLSDNGMQTMAEKFLMASGKLQTLCYKYEIERNLRTMDYAGFQLLSLNDYSGQGTALVGPLNVHWREKGYVTSEEWRQFCNILVPLARFPQFVFTNSDTLRVPVEAYNAWCTDVTGFHTSFFITNDAGRIVASGSFSASPDTLRVGKNLRLGTIVMPLNNVPAPCKLTLHVQFSKDFHNSWDFWVYPPASSTMSNEQCSAWPNDTCYQRDARMVNVTSDYQHALALLNQGKAVLLEAAGKVTLGSDVKQNYLPIFWNTSWFKMRPPHTTGAYIDTTHPLFKYDFPSDTWSNLNWWELLNKAQVMNLMELPADYQPPVQPIDTWHVSRKLGMIIEACVGKGRLLMTTMDISSDLARRHVARQMRQAILRYMQSDDFKPCLSLSPETVAHFFTRQAPPVNMFTNESPDELKPALTVKP